MAKQDSKNIFIKLNEMIYKFINCKLEQKDGSFYVSFIRGGKTKESYIYDSLTMKPKSVIHEKYRKKLKRISYHASGRVNYHHLELGSNYFEPISNITRDNLFAVWSIPSIKLLDKTTKVNEEDYIIDTITYEKRIDFHFALAPWDYKIEYNHIAIRYADLFSLLIIPIKPSCYIPKKLEKAFTVMAPNNGLYKSQVINKDQALINFHQKATNTKGLILYSPNNKGIYTIITSVPMRDAPDVIIEYYDKQYKTEIIDSKNNKIQFKVKNKHGHTVKEEVSIKNIILTSEL